jgi:hypothetical protein
MPAAKTRPVGVQPPGWRYRPAAETTRPGYLRERFAEIAFEAKRIPPSTLCWRCSVGYSMLAERCPHCGASNANVELRKAIEESR